VTTERVSGTGPAATGAGGRPELDPTLDDWLPDEAELEWFPDSEAPPDGSGGGKRGAAVDAVGFASLSAHVIARRRAFALAAVLALAAIAGIGFAVFGGGGSGTRATTPTPTQPATTTPPSSTPTTPSSSRPKASPAVVLPSGKLLRSGDTGSAVRKLQQALKTLGYDPGAVDGSFGPATTQAVVAFQKAKGLSADGIVGPATVAKLNAALAG